MLALQGRVSKWGGVSAIWTPAKPVLQSMWCGTVMRSRWPAQRDTPTGAHRSRLVMPAPIQSSYCLAVAPYSGILGYLCCKHGTCHACSELPAPCPQRVRLWRTLRPPLSCMESYGQMAFAQTARCTLPSSQHAVGASRAALATSAGGHLLRIRQACSPLQAVARISTGSQLLDSTHLQL